MASITLYPTSNVSLNHDIVGGGTAYGALADNSDSTYIKQTATTESQSRTSTFNVGASNSISGRYVINSIEVVSRTRNGYSGMDEKTGHSNLYVGGIEGQSWTIDMPNSWGNQSHTASMTPYTNINGKALTSLPSLVIHLLSTCRVKTTGDNKWVGFSRAYVTINYDNLYSQSAQGSTGVSASLSNSGSAVEGYYRNGTTTTYTATLSNGYGFDGWYTAATGGTRVSRNLSYSETCNSNRTLYARAFAVSVQGETGVTASMSRASDGYTFTFTASMSSDQKYGFRGWYTNSAGTGTPASTNLSYSVALSSAATYYAKVFTVSAQGETGVSAAVSRGSDGRTFTFTGTLDAGTSTSKYGFKGWYSADSGGTQLSTNISYSETLSDNTTYYAKVFTVTATGSTGVSASLTRNSDGRTFTFNASLSNNYAIDGWYDGNTRKSRDVAYSTTLSDSASYTAKAFSVSYSGDSGISVSASRGSDGKTYTFTATLASVTSTTASTFDKWTVNGTGQSETSLTLTKSIDSNATVSASSFTTTVAKDSGFSSASISRTSNTSVTVTAALKDNYALDGWYNGNTRESRTFSYTKTITSDTTLTAKSFTVSYSGDSGISVSASRDSNGYTYTFTCSFIDTEKIKSTLNKWTFNGTDQSWTNLSNIVDVGQNITVSVSSYRTTLDDSSLQGATATIARVSNTSVTLGITTQNGWDFDGWYIGSTKKSSSTSYTVTVSASNTYVPKTIHHVYTVTANGDDYCSASYSSNDLYYGTTVTFTASVTDNRYTFSGWYTDSAGNNLYSSNLQTTKVIDGDIILYAKTIAKNILYIKQNGAWKKIPSVKVKQNGSWTEVGILELGNVFKMNKLYKESGSNLTMFNTGQ